MLNYDKNRLKIFDEFEIDTNLPKHGSQGNMTVDVNRGNLVFINQSVNSDGVTRRFNSQGISVAPTENPMQIIAMEKDSLKSWMGRSLLRLGDKLIGGNKYNNKHVVKESQGPTISVEEFFKSIKNSKTQMGKIDDRIESYKSALAQADTLGQIALKEELLRKIDVVRSESQLYAKNIVKIVLEDQVIKFYKDSERGIRLDWIKNFTRTIPEKFVKVKRELDELKVFDNYVIMHYDPNGEASKMTDEEVEEAKKDPILFGVIADSRKLYYIGDWVDEYCDLTLDGFIEKFGKEALSKNNISTNIDVQLTID